MAQQPRKSGSRYDDEEIAATFLGKTPPKPAAARTDTSPVDAARGRAQEEKTGASPRRKHTEDSPVATPRGNEAVVQHGGAPRRKAPHKNTTPTLRGSDPGDSPTPNTRILGTANGSVDISGGTGAEKNPTEERRRSATEQTPHEQPPSKPTDVTPVGLLQGDAPAAFYMTALREKRSKRLELLVTPSTLEALRQISAKEGVSISETVNQMIGYCIAGVRSV